MKNINHYINSALKLLDSDNFEEAKKILDNLHNENPKNPLIIFLISQIYIKKKEYKVSITYLEKVIKIAPNKPNTKITLADLYLKIHDYTKCLSILNEIEELAQNIVAFFQLKGNYFKAIGDIENSIKNYTIALKLLRKSKLWNYNTIDTSIIDPIQKNTFRYASKSKLEHDLNQINYLIDNKNLPIYEQKQNLIKVIDNWPKELHEDKLIYLNDISFNLIKDFYNRVVYISDYKKIINEPLNKENEYNILEKKYLESRESIIVIDDFLNKEALDTLWNYCLESTIWFDSKENGGYLGAYMTDGFHHPLLINIVKNLTEKMPRIFDSKKLTQMWALKYKSDGQGTRLHADDALININFWITPDSAKNDKNNNSGIIIYDKPVPKNWNFEEYNQSDIKIKNYLKKSESRKIEIPYKQNRAVIFDSKFIHQSQKIDFKKGYVNQRINITMLFDRLIRTF
ncbi:MAG: hypothetical protein CFH01_00972 [Alphaproteobacteria bacterium MarineAlpha2_Bin1]|nr:MAG: hypothetical protein CFH01_00972 [Alphaproteobacteria bacterium MarineAlpha2_Bin1]